MGEFVGAGIDEFVRVKVRPEFQEIVAELRKKCASVRRRLRSRSATEFPCIEANGTWR